MGKTATVNPIPTLTLPLKGREARAQIFAHYLAVGSVSAGGHRARPGLKPASLKLVLRGG
jgi:hypothetical protein